MNNAPPHIKLEAGIESIGICVPQIGFDLSELAILRGIEIDKVKIGLGCDKMALGDAESSIVDIAVTAAQRCLDNWGGDKSQIRLLAVGSETPVDKSRPLSAWVAEGLGLSGSIRSYEVKHACYGGTLAIMQAVEWYLARQCPVDQYALVIAADVCFYEPESPAEATQGAAAVAFIIGRPKIAKINHETVFYSKPVFDFWKPMNETYPRIDGQFSLQCYIEASQDCYSQWLNKSTSRVAEYAALCFHTPFPKMVKKAFLSLNELFGIETEEMSRIFAEKIDPFLEWNKQTGNSYTASVWLGVCRALATLKPGDKLLAFSYGSGCGAELVELEVRDNSAQPWAEGILSDLKNTRYLSAAEYLELRANASKQSQ